VQDKALWSAVSPDQPPLMWKPQRLEEATAPDESWISLLDGLRWINRRDGMLEHDLGTITPNKHHGEIVEPPDLALQSYAIDEKHSHIKFVVPKMLEECILHRCCKLCGHACYPFRTSMRDTSL